MGQIRRRGTKLFIRYYREGKQHEERVGSDDLHVAQNLLKLREGDIAKGIPVTPQMGQVTAGELLDDLLLSYTVKGRDSTRDLEARIRLHLKPFFGKLRASTLTTAEVTRYVSRRQGAKAKNATINRELAALKTAYTLGVKGGKLLARPYIELLPEDNVREGFFEPHQAEAVLRQLEPMLADACRFALETAWRMRKSVLTLTWPDVDFEAGEVRLQAKNSKNGKGCVFPMTDALRTLLLRRQADKAASGVICPFVFHRAGRRLTIFPRWKWRTACKKAGIPGKLLHDFCRTAIREHIRAGIPEKVVMALTNRKSRSIIDRYNIVSPGDLRDAGLKLNARRDDTPARRATR